jgi:hypothetical protein
MQEEALLRMKSLVLWMLAAVTEEPRMDLPLPICLRFLGLQPVLHAGGDKLGPVVATQMFPVETCWKATLASIIGAFETIGRNSQSAACNKCSHWRSSLRIFN